MKDVLGNHLTDRLFHLVHWLSIILLLQKINLGRWRTDCRLWGVGDDGRIANLHEKTQGERGDISQTRRIYFSNRRWTNQNTWRRSGTENIHLDTAATNSSRGSLGLSWRIRRIFSTTSRLTSGCRWSNSRFLVHVGQLHIPPSRWTQSQTLLAEIRIIPYSTKIHWRNQNYSCEFGCQAGEAHWWSLEHWWLSRLVWSLDRFHTIYSSRRKSSWRIYLIRGETYKETAYIRARSSMARALEVNGKECQAEAEAKVVWRKDSSWKRKKIAWNLFHRPRG